MLCHLSKIFFSYCSLHLYLFDGVCIQYVQVTCSFSSLQSSSCIFIYRRSSWLIGSFIFTCLLWSASNIPKLLIVFLLSNHPNAFSFVYGFFSNWFFPSLVWWCLHPIFLSYSLFFFSPIIQTHSHLSNVFFSYCFLHLYLIDGVCFQYSQVTPSLGIFFLLVPFFTYLIVCPSNIPKLLKVFLLSNHPNAFSFV